MSYNGIGLKSAKGSSTSGHIQRSLAYSDEGSQSKLKNYTARRKDKFKDSRSRLNEGVRKSPKDILGSQEAMVKHLGRRQVEVAVSELRDELEEDEVDESVINERCDKLRKKLLNELETERRVSGVYKTRSERSTEDSCVCKGDRSSEKEGS